MNTIVYSYDVVSLPAGSIALLEREIQGGHLYYNCLIEIERAHLERKAALRREHLPGLDDAEAAVSAVTAETEQARAAIRARNAQSRRLTATAEERVHLTQLQERLREARQARRAILLAVQGQPAYLSALASIQDQHNAVRREAYAEAECSWGTRLKVAQAVESALTITTPDGKRRQRTPAEPPHFRRWTGDGLAAVQLQNGLPAGRLLLGTDPRFRLERAGGKRMVAHMRLGIGSERQPIVLKAFLTYHRPLPPDAVVTWAVLTRRRGPRRCMKDGTWKPWDSYQLQLTVRTEREKPQATGGHVGIDLGWRLMEEANPQAGGSLRVAFWRGDRPVVWPSCLLPHLILADPDGSAGELRIDPSGWLKVHDLQAIRDGHRVDLQRLLLEWRERQGSRLPAWLLEATETLPQWRSASRFCWLADLWREHAAELSSHEMIGELLKQYRKREAHLWQWQRTQEVKNQRRRKELYRQFAACLARHYRLLCVEDCDWRTLNRLPDTEDNEAINLTARRHIRMAAVGELRQALRYSGGKVVFCDAANTTRQCHVCGSLNDWDQAGELHHTCSCGATWDQDDNAARVLLARALIMIETVAPARESENGASNGVAANGVSGGGRWQRRKAARSRKLSGNEENPADEG